MRILSDVVSGKRFSGKRIAAVSVGLAMVLGLNGTSRATAGVNDGTNDEKNEEMTTSLASTASKYSLKLHNMHTGESLDIVYKIGGEYLPEALEKLNYFLRDRHTADVSDYDPKEFDVLHGLLTKLRRPNGVIDVVCGYRTPETNAALRQDSPQTGVAEHSQHMEGRAIDLRVPGVSTAQLRNAALSLHAGGVGYYPKSQFVHVDVGPVRTWSFGKNLKVKKAVGRRKGGKAHRGRHRA